jgi:hypothetical protein
MVKRKQATEGEPEEQNTTKIPVSRRRFLGTLGAATLIPPLQVLGSEPVKFLLGSPEIRRGSHEWLLGTEGISGLKKLGIDRSYEIVIADNASIVENTAAEMLQKFLGEADLHVRIVPESNANGQKQFLLGRDTNLRALARFGESGELKLSGVSAEDDGFHLKRIGQNFVVAGANPRGVLYGVYAFEDFVRAGANGNLDIKRVPYFRKRGHGPCYTVDFSIPYLTEDVTEEEVAYLSRLGVNELTDQLINGPLRRFVKSDVFSFQEPPPVDYQRRVKALSGLCNQYGIDQYIFLQEPVLSNIPGELEKYPKEALGTVRPPYGGGKDGTNRTLCVSSPIVQEHLRNMMRKLVREYPDVKGALFYNLDIGAWLCTPELCVRCKKVCTDSPPNEYNPWETQARLVTLLAEAAHEENPDFDFRFWGATHYHGERFDKLIRATQGFNSVLCSWTAGDRTVMIPDAAIPDPAFIMSQKIAAERGIPFYMVYESNSLEQIPQSLPFPFHVCDAMKKFKRWDTKYLTQIFGLTPEHNPINGLVTTEFQWNPDQSPEEFLANLSARQFGEVAGKLMYQAWKEMQKAFDAWNDLPNGPFALSGSETELSIGIIGGQPPAILPEIVPNYNARIKVLIDVAPWFAAGYEKFREPIFLENMKLMSVHLREAAKYAKQAIAAASDKEFISICYYEGVDGRPTCREYAELNHASIAIGDSLCKERCNMLRAYHLLTEIESVRAAGDETSVKGKERLYHQLIREDIGVQEDFYKLLTSFSVMRPYYTRTSLTEKEISDWLLSTRAKINVLTRFLNESTGSKS